MFFIINILVRSLTLKRAHFKKMYASISVQKKKLSNKLGSFLYFAEQFFFLKTKEIISTHLLNGILYTIVGFESGYKNISKMISSSGYRKTLLNCFTWPATPKLFHFFHSCNLLILNSLTCLFY